jgi:hypothetical protein
VIECEAAFADRRTRCASNPHKADVW